VLHDHRGCKTVGEAEAIGADELVRKLPRRLGVEQVQVRQLPAAVLDKALPQPAGLPRSR